MSVDVDKEMRLKEEVIQNDTSEGIGSWADSGLEHFICAATFI